MTDKNRVIGYIDGLNVYGGLKNPPYRKQNNSIGMPETLHHPHRTREGEE